MVYVYTGSFPTHAVHGFAHPPLDDIHTRMRQCDFYWNIADSARPSRVLKTTPTKLASEKGFLARLITCTIPYIKYNNMHIYQQYNN